VPPKQADPYYFTPEWKALRQACLKRDGYACVMCGEPAIVADHIISRKAGGTDALSNLRSLCREHDNRFKERPGGWRRGAPEGV
jgi:5-methylcytosine-specific restriction endonuclease McrA